MNPLSSLFYLFESADQKRVRITAELTRLRTQVESEKSSASVSYRDTFRNHGTWIQIGKLEKQLARLNGAVKVAK